MIRRTLGKYLFSTLLTGVGLLLISESSAYSAPRAKVRTAPATKARTAPPSGPALTPAPALTSTPAPMPIFTPAPRPFLLNRADLFLTHVRQSNGNITTAMGAWRPSYIINPEWEVTGFLGASPFKNNLGTHFLATEYSVLAHHSFPRSPWAGELGFGFQTWFKNGGTRPLIRAEAIYELPNRLFVVNRVLASYALNFISNNNAHQISLGVGASF